MPPCSSKNTPKSTQASGVTHKLSISRRKIAQNPLIWRHSANCQLPTANSGSSRSRGLGGVVAGELGEDLFEGGGFGGDAGDVDACGHERAHQAFASAQGLLGF